MSPMRKDPFAKKTSSNCFAGWTGTGERSIFLVLRIASMSRTTQAPSVTKHGPISGPGRYDAGHRCARQTYDQRHRSVEHTYDCRHWRAGRPMRYTTENKRISHRWGHTHEIQARADHPNAIHAISRLVPAVDPLGHLSFRLRGLSLRGLDDAACHPPQLASAHRDLWGLARDLSYRTTAVSRPPTTTPPSCPVFPRPPPPTSPPSRPQTPFAPTTTPHHPRLSDH